MVYVVICAVVYVVVCVVVYVVVCVVVYVAVFVVVYVVVCVVDYVGSCASIAEQQKTAGAGASSGLSSASGGSTGATGGSVGSVTVNQAESRSSAGQQPQSVGAHPGLSEAAFKRAVGETPMSQDELEKVQHAVILFLCNTEVCMLSMQLVDSGSVCVESVCLQVVTPDCGVFTGEAVDSAVGRRWRCVCRECGLSACCGCS